MSKELKLCPFCGSTEAKLTKCHAEWGYGWHVTCNNCLSVGETAYSDRTGMTAKTPEEKGREMKAHAVTNWNRRAPSDHDGDATEMVDDNPPLTLEELRCMDGEPVWCENFEMWALIYCQEDWDPLLMLANGSRIFNSPARHYTIYRRKPEEKK